MERPTATDGVLRELDSYRSAIREAFEEGFSMGTLQGSIAAAWERSEARQTEWAFAHTRMSVGALVSGAGGGNQPSSGLRGDPVAPRTATDDTRDKRSSSSDES